MKTIRVCPTCKTNDRIYSVELVEIMYSLRILPDGTYEYTGDDTVIGDDGGVSQGLFCRNCDTEIADTSDLVEIEEEA